MEPVKDEELKDLEFTPEEEDFEAEKKPKKELFEEGTDLDELEDLEHESVVKGNQPKPVKGDKESNPLNGPNEHEGLPENPEDVKNIAKAEKVVKPAGPVKGPVLETRRCEDCQGDGKWDGELCKVCHGSGKIFKDGVVVLTATGQTFKANAGELK